MTEKLYDYEPVAKDIPVGELKTSPTNDIFRYIEKAEYEYLKKSISRNIKTGYFKARPCLVSDRTGEYIIFGGNHRYKAAKELGYTEIPCYVFSGLSEEEEVGLMMTDNGHFAKFNHQELANFFESDVLAEFGIFGAVVFPDEELEDYKDVKDLGDSFELKDGDRAPYQQMSFSFSDAQADFIKKVISDAKKESDYESIDNFGNENNNGNAIYYIVKKWAEQKK